MNREWGNTHFEQLDDRPDDLLCRQRCASVPKAERGVEVDFSPPADCEEDGGDRVEDEPPIPAGHIQLEDEDTLTRVAGPGALDP